MYSFITSGEHAEPRILAQARSWLNQVKFKPGWSFGAHYHSERLVYISVVYDTLDSYHPEKRATLYKGEYLDFTLIRDPEAWFYDRIYGMICEMEDHERDEWWIVKGDRPHDPHA